MSAGAAWLVHQAAAATEEEERQLAWPSACHAWTSKPVQKENMGVGELQWRHAEQQARQQQRVQPQQQGVQVRVPEASCCVPSPSHRIFSALHGHPPSSSQVLAAHGQPPPSSHGLAMLMLESIGAEVRGPAAGQLPVLDASPPSRTACPATRPPA